MVAAILALLLSTLTIQVAHGQTADPLQIRAEILARVTNQMDLTPVGEPFVFRVDQLADELAARANASIANEQERINFVMEGLQATGIWGDVLQTGSGEPDLMLFAAAMVGALPGKYGVEPHPGFLESRQAAFDLQKEGRNLTEDVLVSYDKVIAEYGQDETLPLSAAPFYIVTYGYEFATNAKNYGIIPGGDIGAGRNLIVLNIGAHRMLEPDYFDSATIHETWHCFHSPTDLSPDDLLKRTLREGVVMYLTSVIGPEYSDHTLLFWSEEELSAAEARKADILMEYQAARLETDQAKVNEWYVLGVPLSTVPGAPSRSGYYVALLVFRAYTEQISLVQPAAADQEAIFLLEKTDSPEGREEMWQTLAVQEGLVADDMEDTPSPEPSTSSTISVLSFWGMLFVSSASILVTTH